MFYKEYLQWQAKDTEANVWADYRTNLNGNIKGMTGTNMHGKWRNIVKGNHLRTPKINRSLDLFKSLYEIPSKHVLG